MIETQLGPEHVMVTFRLDDTKDAGGVTVAGDFNDWSTTANPMTRNAHGFETQVPLTPGRSYRFRYVLDGERWENDSAAHAYVANEYGTEDSVVDLTNVKDTAVPDEPGGGE